MVIINKTFVKSPTGICLIILTVLSFIASILSQFVCAMITIRYQCVYIASDSQSGSVYGPNMAAFALSVTWIGSLILFIMKLCGVQKADLKCWKITDYVMSGLMILLCFLGFVTLIAYMVERASVTVYSWIAATVFLAADIGILIFMIIAITRHYRHKEGDLESKHQKDVKESMDHPSLKIKSISLSKQGNGLNDPKTEPTPVGSSTQPKMKQKMETVSNAEKVVPPIGKDEAVPPIAEPQADSSEHESEGTVKNQSEKTQESEKAVEKEPDSGAKEKEVKKSKKNINV